MYVIVCVYHICMYVGITYPTPDVNYMCLWLFVVYLIHIYSYMYLYALRMWVYKHTHVHIIIYYIYVVCNRAQTPRMYTYTQ